MIEHMKRKTWEHLDEDELFEKQVSSRKHLTIIIKFVFKQERFIRDFSLEGFGSRIDDAVLRMFPDSYMPRPVQGNETNVEEEKTDKETVLVMSSPPDSKLPQLQKYPKFVSQRNSVRQRA